jgi:ketosteroid isomerase-like protein
VRSAVRGAGCAGTGVPRVFAHLARRTAHLALLATLGCALGTPGQRGLDVETRIRALERRRFEAMRVADIHALDTLLANDLTYTHTTGRVDDKGTLLSDLHARRIVYDSIVPSDVRVRVYGRTAAATGTARMQVRANGAVARFTARFTELYVDNAGRWQLVAWQSTRVP